MIQTFSQKKNRAKKTEYLIQTESHLPGYDLLRDSSQLFDEIANHCKDNAYIARTLESLHHLNILYAAEARLYKIPQNPVDVVEISGSEYGDTQYPERHLESVETSKALYTELMHLELSSFPRSQITELSQNLTDIVDTSQYLSGYPLFLIEWGLYSTYSNAFDFSTDDSYENILPPALEQSAHIVYHLAPFTRMSFQLFDRPFSEGVLLDKDGFMQTYGTDEHPQLLSTEETYEAVLKTLGYHMMRLERDSQKYGVDLDPFFSSIKERSGNI